VSEPSFRELAARLLEVKCQQLRLFASHKNADLAKFCVALRAASTTKALLRLARYTQVQRRARQPR
jgi:hypothetical protein